VPVPLIKGGACGAAGPRQRRALPVGGPPGARRATLRRASGSNGSFRAVGQPGHPPVRSCICHVSCLALLSYMSTHRSAKPAARNEYHRLMAWTGPNRNARRAVVPVLVLAAAACSNSPSLPAHPSTAHATPGPVTESFVRNRFTVTLSTEALEKASADGTNLPQVIAHSLSRINALLPGPATAIAVSYMNSGLIPQTGTSGVLTDHKASRQGPQFRQRGWPSGDNPPGAGRQGADDRGSCTGLPGPAARDAGLRVSAAPIRRAGARRRALARWCCRAGCCWPRSWLSGRP
jgi:hypothetical protein